MIISHKNKYLFIEIPHTGTSSIRRELCELYDGVPVPIRRHASYPEFLKIAKASEREYFTFACVRNPLDVAVTNYFKQKSDQEGRFSATDEGTVSADRKVRRDSLARYRYLKETGADFPTYFKRFYKWPYSNAIQVSRKYCHFIMRYDNLEGDFGEVLSRIGLEQKRPLPKANRTQAKGRDFLVHYTPDIRARAQWVFGPYMREWGFEFPASWGNGEPSIGNRMVYGVTNALRQIAWTYVRPSQTANQ